MYGTELGMHGEGREKHNIVTEMPSLSPKSL